MVLPYEKIVERVVLAGGRNRSVTRQIMTALWTHDELKIFGRVQAALLSDSSPLLHSWVGREACPRLRLSRYPPSLGHA